VAENWSPEKMKRFADQLEEHALYNRNQAISWQRWVMAASLTINGGAAIAVLNLSQIDGTSRLWAIGWFVVGLLATISFGTVASIQMSRFSGFYKIHGWKIGNLESNSGEFDQSKLDLKSFDKLLKRDNDIFWIQFIGLIGFVIGIIIAVEGLL